MLTARQHETYQFIKHYIATRGYAPTEAEIALGIGIKSTGVVHRYVSAIAAEGWITITPAKRRNIGLVADADDGSSPLGGLPIMGRIAAGRPIEAIAEATSLNIADHILGPNRFVLHVSGDSMIGDNICDGDYIICESAQTAQKNQIVVALIDGSEATLKRFYANEDGTVSLIPSNAHLSPMRYPAERITIQGIYLGLLRFTT